LFRRFFGDPRDRSTPPERQPEGQGTGFLISADGFIITNHHVAGDAVRVTVRLHDRREFPAKVVGSDRHTDVALLKIEGSTPFPALPLGDSDPVAPGQWVMAIGNPFGLSHTVTTGIISSRGRGQMGIVDYEDFLQTDAAINPGNSGGPLLDPAGRVIGINSAIISRSGGNLGIGFAIPINLAMKVVEQLKAGGTVARGRLGVMIQDLTPELATSFALPDGTAGILVSQVVPGSPAEQAGIAVGDVILERDGEAVTSVAVFRNAVALTRPGTTVTLAIWRNQARIEVKPTIGGAEGDEVAAADGSPAGEGRLGLRLAPLTDEVRRRFGDERLVGVLIVAVTDDSPADRAGLRPGGILLRVDGTVTGTVAAAGDALARAATGAAIRLLIRDAEGTRFVMLHPGQSRGGDPAPDDRPGR
jgi:serine protease Do